MNSSNKCTYNLEVAASIRYVVFCENYPNERQSIGNEWIYCTLKYDQIKSLFVTRKALMQASKATPKKIDQVLHLNT
jgi:hypothetical protein